MTETRYCTPAGALAALILATSMIGGPELAAGQSLAGSYNDLAVMRALRNEWEPVRGYLDSALTYDPGSPIALNNLGNFFVCAGQFDSAMQLYVTALAADSGAHAPYYNMAIAFYLAGRPEHAVELMSKALGHVGADSNLLSIIQQNLLDIDVDKGDPSKLSQLEIRQLLDAARARRDSALERSRAQMPAQDSLPDTAGKADTSREATPAGGKASQARFVSGQLYWMTYGRATHGRPD